MHVDFTKSFDKQFQKLHQKKQRQVRDTVAVFLDDASAPSLRNHGLKGEWIGHRSISAGGDLRLHYRVVAPDRVLFVAVGSHSRLYR
jgi:addiction module RelE/StbE family toxin